MFGGEKEMWTKVKNLFQQLEDFLSFIFTFFLFYFHESGKSLSKPENL